MQELLDRVRPGRDLAAQQSLATLQGALFGRASSPARIGPYAFSRRLGAGASGIVLRATDERDGREVAVKFLHAADTDVDAARARLLREAQTLARIRSDHIVQVLDVITYDPAELVPGAKPGAAVCVVMELVEGLSLDRWLDAAVRPWPDVLAIFLQAGEGLAAAHAAGIVHRDFKPSNVMVGTEHRVRILDFGLARATKRSGPAVPVMLPGRARTLPPELAALVQPLDITLTRPGLRLGTPCYMAPEQHAGGRADPASDQYAFCVALYEAWCRHRPFVAETEAELARQKHVAEIQPPPRDVAVPARVFDIVRRGLSPAAEDRWGSMAELVAALREAAAAPRRRWVVGLGIALALVLAVLVALVNWG